MRVTKLKPPFDALAILIGIVVVAAGGAAVLSLVLLAVGKSIGQ